MSIYEQLEAACLPLIRDYQTDLTKHDREAIESNPGIPFLHWTKDSGTWMVHLWPLEKLPAKGERVPYLFGTATREHVVNEIKTIAELMCKERGRIQCCYRFDGQRLLWLTVGEAADAARSYRRRMFDLFDGKPARREVTHA